MFQPYMVKVLMNNNSVLRNCMGERVLHCKMAASSYVCQPNHSYVWFVYTVILHNVTQCELSAYA